jgi:hypothetical protein
MGFEFRSLAPSAPTLAIGMVEGTCGDELHPTRHGYFHDFRYRLTFLLLSAGQSAAMALAATDSVVS